MTGLENPYLSVTVAISGIIISIIALHYNRKQTFAAEKSINIAQEGLKNGLIEQLRGAVDQLGNEKLEIRLGGIYALERISNESEKDYWPIMEILTAYVRENSSAEISEVPGGKKDFTRYSSNSHNHWKT